MQALIPTQLQSIIDTKCVVHYDEECCYFFGGIINDNISSDLYRFDVQTGEILKVFTNSFPPPRSNHSLCLYNNSLIVYGGCAKEQILNDLWCFDFDTGIWKQLFINEPYPYLSGHCGVIVGDELYLLGSKSKENMLSYSLYNSISIHCINLQTGKYHMVCDTLPCQTILSPANFLSYQRKNDHMEFSNIPCQRHSSFCYANNNHIFLAGGISVTGETLSDIWKYSVTSKQWTYLYHDSQQAHISPGASVTGIGNTLLFNGGLFATLAAFQTETRTWNGPQALDNPLLHHTTCLYNHSTMCKLIVIGGYTFEQPMLVSDYNPRTQYNLISFIGIDRLKNLKMTISETFEVPVSLESTESQEFCEIGKEIVQETTENDLNVLKTPSLDDVCYLEANYLFKISQCDTITPEFNQLCTPTIHSRNTFSFASPLENIRRKLFPTESGIPSIPLDLARGPKELYMNAIPDSSPLNHHNRSKSLNFSKIYRPTMMVPLDVDFDENRKPEPSPPEFVTDFDDNRSESSLQITPLPKSDSLDRYKKYAQAIKKELKEVTELQDGIQTLVGRFPGLEQEISKFTDNIATIKKFTENNEMISVMSVADLIKKYEALCKEYNSLL